MWSLYCCVLVTLFGVKSLTAAIVHAEPEVRVVPGTVRVKSGTVQTFEIPESKTPIKTWLSVHSGIYPDITPEHREDIQSGEPVSMLIYLNDQHNKYDIKAKDCWASSKSDTDDPDVAKIQLTNGDGCPIQSKLINYWSKAHNEHIPNTKLIFTNLTSFHFPNQERLHLSCNIEVCYESCKSNCMQGKTESSGVKNIRLTRGTFGTDGSLRMPELAVLLGLRKKQPVAPTDEPPNCFLGSTDSRCPTEKPSPVEKTPALNIRDEPPSTCIPGTDDPTCRPNSKLPTSLVTTNQTRGYFPTDGCYPGTNDARCVTSTIPPPESTTHPIDPLPTTPSQVFCFPGSIHQRCPILCYPGFSDRRCPVLCCPGCSKNPMCHHPPTDRPETPVCFVGSNDPRCPRICYEHNYSDECDIIVPEHPHGGKPDKPNKPDGDNWDYGKPSRPDWDYDKPNRPDWDYGKPKPDGPYRPDWDDNKPKPEWPYRPDWDYNKPKPDKPHRPEWENNKPKPDRPQWLTELPPTTKPKPDWPYRPDRPDRPDWDSNNPYGPRPDWDDNKPYGPKPRPDRPPRPDWDDNKPKPDHTHRPDWEDGGYGRPRPDYEHGSGEGRPDRPKPKPENPHPGHPKPDRPRPKPDHPYRPDGGDGGGYGGPRPDWEHGSGEGRPDRPDRPRPRPDHPYRPDWEGYRPDEGAYNGPRPNWPKPDYGYGPEYQTSSTTSTTPATSTSYSSIQRDELSKGKPNKHGNEHGDTTHRWPTWEETRPFNPSKDFLDKLDIYRRHPEAMNPDDHGFPFDQRPTRQKRPFNDETTEASSETPSTEKSDTPEGTTEPVTKPFTDISTESSTVTIDGSTRPTCIDCKPEVEGEPPSIPNWPRPERPTHYPSRPNWEYENSGGSHHYPNYYGYPRPDHSNYGPERPPPNYGSVHPTRPPVTNPTPSYYEDRYPDTKPHEPQTTECSDPNNNDPRCKLFNFNLCAPGSEDTTCIKRPEYIGILCYIGSPDPRCAYRIKKHPK